ncbi:hypothetical protein ABDK00_001545 [Niabella insulamsoli]|uniref:hypothetical protein n=1 Tax=Niabella insulamsoli TaxID=3144874 RepID=UPI0031FD4CA7
MERNTITTVDKLQLGDRFYKANDKNKTVLTKVESEIKVTIYRTYRHFAKTDKEKFPQPINANTRVVFLRNENQK